MSQPDSRDVLVEKDGQLARLHAATGRLLDQISHDFRTPLTVIKEYATLMRDGLVGTVSPRQREFLETIDDRADDLTTMVDNVLDAGKLSAGVLRLWRQPTDVAGQIAHVRPLLARKAALKGVRLDVVIEPNLPQVYADREQLGRILMNVLGGALASFQHPEAVGLWARSDAGHGDVLLGLTVEGGRIEPDRLEAIRVAMDPVPSCDVSDSKGVVLGLALASRLVDFHFGQARFERTADGEAAFSLSLPVNKPLRLLDGYLHHLARHRPGPQQASLIVAAVSSRVKSAVAGVVDEFLQHALGTDDLVVGVEKHRWLLLVLGGKQSVASVLDRVDAAWSETRQSRPGGLLPQLELSELDRGSLPSDADDLIDRFQKEMAATVDTNRRPVVLAVDDDRALLANVKSELEAAGYEVLTATDGQAAVELTQSHLPEVVLTDSRLPALDGLVVLERLREDRRTADIPVVVLSARLAERPKALERGARLFLRKPIAPAMIVTALAGVVDPPNSEPVVAAGGALLQPV